MPSSTAEMLDRTAGGAGWVRDDGGPAVDRAVADVALTVLVTSDRARTAATGPAKAEALA